MADGLVTLATGYGRHARGETAASALLEGFEVEVSAVFDAPETGG